MKQTAENKSWYLFHVIWSLCWYCFFQNQNFSTFASFLGCSWSKHHLATGLLDLISGLHESWIVTCQFSQTLKSEVITDAVFCMFLHVESVKKKASLKRPNMDFRWVLPSKTLRPYRVPLQMKV